MRKPRLLIPSIGLLLGVFVISGIVQVAMKRAPEPSEVAPASLEETPGKSAAELRAERLAFYESQIDPVIIQMDQKNREASEQCIATLRDSLEGYRKGIKPFCTEINTWGTRLGVIRRMPGDWWYEKTDVSDFIQEKFARYLFTDQELSEDIEIALMQFQMAVRGNQNEMLDEIRLAITASDLTDVPAIKTEDVVEDVTQQLQDFGEDSAQATLVRGITVKVASAAGGAAGEFLLSQLVVELASMAGAASTAAGGATAGGAAVGGGGGSLGGPLGAAAGIAVGVVIGGVIDWWMSSKFEEQMTQTLNQMIDEMTQIAIEGSDQNPGLATGLQGSCDFLLQSHREFIKGKILNDVDRNAQKNE